MPVVAVYVIAVVLGLLIGSFLNVVIVRVPEGHSIVTGGSACPSCGAQIRPYDNVPVVSWLVLRGRCRDCGARISPMYPIVELAGAAIVVLCLWLFWLTWDGVMAVVLLLGLVPLAVIDARVKRLPNPIVATLAVLGIALVLVAGATTDEWRRVIEAVISGLAAFAFFVVLAEGSQLLTGRSGMGWGDVKLAGVLGLYLGWLAPRYVIIGLLLAFFSGAIVGVGLIVFGKGTRTTALPFGVYLALGALLAVIVAQPIGDWYLRVGGG